VRNGKQRDEAGAAAQPRHRGQQRAIPASGIRLLNRSHEADSIGMKPAMNTAAPDLILSPIGYMRAAHATKVDAPRQPAAAVDATGVIELLPGRNLEHAIEDLADWPRIWVIFWFDRNAGWRPKVLPPRSTTGRKGVLATRSPHRPNPLGLSVLRLDRIEGLRLHVRDVDLLDGTPVLDIKPYVPYTDAHPEGESGWLQQRDPAPAYTVQLHARAMERIEWIAQHSSLPLRQRIEATLALGPQPHPYRRIRPAAGGMVLAVQDWRVDFRAEGQVIEVLDVRSGYRTSQLVQAADDEPLRLHRGFRAHFG
jgi:tRNA-Thr(GGU) m(6)t(6)A37 methyltransferase TsaA